VAGGAGEAKQRL